MTQQLEILEQMKAALDDAYAAGVRNANRPWVGLGDKEIAEASKHFNEWEGFVHGACWAQEKLKEKNT